jgi:hypothetical protein
VCDLLYVETAGGHVGRHDDLDLAGTQPTNGLLPLRLRHVAVHRFRRVAAGLQALGDIGRVRLRAYEHERSVGGLYLQHAREGIELLPLRHVEVPLFDSRYGQGRALDLDPLGIAQVALGDPLDRRRHRRGEEGHLPRGGHLAEDPLHVFDETHAQHLIGLVENDGS